MSRARRGDVRALASAASAALLAEIRGPLGWAVIATFTAVNVFLAVSTRHDVRVFWPTALALVLFVAAMPPAVRNPGPRQRTTTTWLVAATPALLALLVSWQLPIDRSPGYASWHIGAGSFLLFFLAVGYRWVAAWTGFAAMVTVTAAWALSTGQGWGTVLSLSGTHAVLIALGTTVGLAVRRNDRTIRSLIAQDEARAVEQAKRLARAAERDRHQAELDHATRPVLERLAAGDPLSAEERARLAVLEADLRDRLRSPVLAAPVLARAVTQARRRGVRVQLLDDGALSGAGADELDAALGPVAQIVAGIDAGEVVVRILPRGRPDLVTVVVEGPQGWRRTTFAADGSRRETGEDGDGLVTARTAPRRSR
ncbi:hypothetical protein V5H98_17600 [Georgenia sp. M64]|uniref:hypothetical protein n=1 Tax=Georgenia sp. M64 TaxID=3120520 RepID=UPI0030E17DFC